MSDVYIASTDAVVEVDGNLVTIRAGVTRADSDHPIVKQNPGLFQPVTEGVHFAVRTARKEPKVSKRAAKKAAATEPKGATTPAGKATPQAAAKVESKADGPADG